jgi:hypothetical protein
LRAIRAGIDNATGKGSETERIIYDRLVKPNLPPGFVGGKGAVIASDRPEEQSPTIDRVIWDAAAASPLVFAPDHSIFLIEAVAALVEITMRLDAQKLREDVAHMAPIKAMRNRQLISPAPGSKTRSLAFTPTEHPSVRSFIVGLPASTNWSARDIAHELRSIQRDIGSP